MPLPNSRISVLAPRRRGRQVGPADDRVPYERVPRWMTSALAAAAGTSYGDVLYCAFKIPKLSRPRFVGRATITREHQILCDLEDASGALRANISLGSVGALLQWVDALSAKLKLSPSQERMLRRYLYLWIGRDERPRRVALREGPGP